MEESDRKCREHEESQKAKEEEEATDAAGGDDDKGNNAARFEFSRHFLKKNFPKIISLSVFSSRADFASISFVSCATATEKLDSIGSVEEPQEEGQSVAMMSPFSPRDGGALAVYKSLFAQ